MSAEIRLAVVGASGTAAKRVLPTIERIAGVTVSALQTRVGAAAERLAARFEVPRWTTKLDALLAVEDFDAFFIATPPYRHIEDVRACAAHGKPILCEKPLALEVAQVDEISKIARAAQIDVRVAHHLRHQPAVRGLRASIDSGECGDLVTGSGGWSFSLDSQSKNYAWKSVPELGGAHAFHDAGVHVLDLLLHLFGMPSTVTATASQYRGEQAVTVAAILTFNTLAVTLTCSWQTAHDRRDFTLSGSAGRLEATAIFGETYCPQLIVQRADGQDVYDYDPRNLYEEQLRNFAAGTVMGEVANECTTLDEARCAVVVLEALTTSIGRGCTVQLGSVSCAADE
jgi:predicted dehydrogenase